MLRGCSLKVFGENWRTVQVPATCELSSTRHWNWQRRRTISVSFRRSPDASKTIETAATIAATASASIAAVGHHGDDWWNKSPNAVHRRHSRFFSFFGSQCSKLLYASSRVHTACHHIMEVGCPIRLENKWKLNEEAIVVHCPGDSNSTTSGGFPQKLWVGLCVFQ